MENSSEKIKEIWSKFYSELLYNPIYASYLRGSKISTLEELSKEWGMEITLRSDENPTDYCFAVELKKRVPNNLNLPREYEGVRVFYQLQQPHDSPPPTPQ